LGLAARPDLLCLKRQKRQLCCALRTLNAER
jgi:hypothetical protein